MTDLHAVVPETPGDISTSIFTFLHLTESNLFQLLYVDVDDQGANDFQVFGKFNGEVVSPFNGDAFFVLKTLELKLVNMGKNDLYAIKKATLERNTNGELQIEAIIEPVKAQKRGVDVVITTDMGIQKNELIDCQVKPGNHEPSNRNGRPCFTKAHF